MTKMIFLMVLAFVAAWSGYAILSIIRLYGSGFSDYLIGFVMMIAKSGASLNTFVFILMNQEVNCEVQGIKSRTQYFSFLVSKSFVATMDFGQVLFRH